MLNEMNQLCKVCAEPAAGFHFGAFTCEGCKSFFGRTYNNLSSLSECKNNGRCVINKKSRTSCKSCRLRKCLMVGMSKSGSRYGRRSNWFKIHCLLQDQSLHNGQMESSLSYNDIVQKMASYPSKEEGKEEMMPRSPDSHSDYCGELDSKTLNGYDGIVKSGSLSPLSPYESPSPPYDKKESFLSMPGHPISPLPPMSPVAALHHQQKLFGHAAAAAAAASFLQNGYNGLHRLSNGAGADPLAFRSFAPTMPSNLDLLLKKRKPFIIDVHPAAPRLPCTAATEQDMPMDLSVKKPSNKTTAEIIKSDDEEEIEEATEETVTGGPSCRKGQLESPLDLTNRSYDDSDDSGEECVQN
ncbi:hypothetical protein CHUAL_001279 [Chamberlinius hualienensis]